MREVRKGNEKQKKEVGVRVCVGKGIRTGAGKDHQGEKFANYQDTRVMFERNLCTHGEFRSFPLSPLHCPEEWERQKRGKRSMKENDGAKGGNTIYNRQGDRPTDRPTDGRRTNPFFPAKRDSATPSLPSPLSLSREMDSPHLKRTVLLLLCWSVEKHNGGSGGFFPWDSASRRA